MKRVAISDLKSHLSEHLRSAEAGETIEVMDRARPIVRVVPIASEAGGLEIVAPLRSFASVRKTRLRPIRLAMTSLEALLRERGDR